MHVCIGLLVRSLEFDRVKFVFWCEVIVGFLVRSLEFEGVKLVVWRDVFYAWVQSPPQRRSGQPPLSLALTMGMCCSRRHTHSPASPASDDSDTDAEPSPGLPLFDSAPDADASPDASPISPLSPDLTQMLPCPSWGHSFFQGRELRRRAGLDSQSREVDQASQSDS